MADVAIVGDTLESVDVNIGSATEEEADSPLPPPSIHGVFQSE